MHLKKFVMKKKVQTYVPVIGLSLIQPIARLLEELDSLGPTGPNEVQASVAENGYSVSIVALCALVIESALNRTSYIQSKQSPKKPIDFFRQRFSSSPLGDDIEELFVVRDAIVHNHLWDTKFRWTATGMKLISTTLLPGYGDRKFRAVIDTKSRMTKKLGMNLFPTRVCKTDAIITLKVMSEVLLFLEGQDLRYFPISNHHISYKGKMLAFLDFKKTL